MPSDEQVTISKTEYTALKKAALIMEYLEAAGVDNWEWYDDALSECRAENKDVFND